ncbi:SDR family NAD(P)-dependent oxidoreductase [Rhodococcus sp. WAY2]|uniref:SDR family NAD(P)-dependent oxidoreductase n=1 Tax=Rhodococcus sp. WAY2 TaxID=2663121 RepID=UPI00132027D3|nr:SDR family oxidoreductase [Rhodococcus sp. WAY2]QHE73401.1 3-oxoacyl-[acyl-carrier protein] reductase [Rhodococcus sp. WAY2]
MSSSPSPDFSTGTALVIGGSGGIGRVICRRLAEAGSDVVLTYRRNEATAEEVAAQIRSLKRRTAVEALNTEDEAETKKCVDQVANEFGGLHTLVYASGPDLPMMHISRTPPHQFRDYLLQDAAGFFNLVHAAIPHLRASQGSIVALHTAGLRRYPAKDILSVAPKAAVEAIIRGVAREEGRYGVRANGVGIGGVEAGMHWRLRESGHYNAAALEILQRNRALPYAGRAEDVAEAVLYLASGSAARYVTGQTINTDGGYAL